MQVWTGTLAALFDVQSVATKSGEVAATGVQLETPVGPVVTGAGHVTEVQKGAVAMAGVHDATGVLLALLMLQVVVVHRLPEVPGEFEQV